MSERLEALSEELAQLVRRQRELEERVRALETHDLAEEPAAQPPPLPMFEPPPPPPVVLTRPEIPPPEPLETTVGLNWINRIAVVTLLLGAAFLFKYGVDNDWFGPGVRVAMGIAAAIISLFAGDRLWRRGQTVFAQGIVGLGLALLYLSIYAAAMLYHLLPQSLAFIAMCGVTAGAGWLALLYNSQAVAVIAMIGGYLTPPALSTGEDHPWILFGYVFLLNVGGLWLARKRRWEALEPIAAAATILLYAAWFSAWFGDANRPVATVFAFAFYAQFSVATLSELWAVFQLGASIALALVWRDQGSLRLVESRHGCRRARDRIPAILGRGAPVDTGMLLAAGLALVQSRCFVRGDLRRVLDLFRMDPLAWTRARARIWTDRRQCRDLLCGVLHVC